MGDAADEDDAGVYTGPATVTVAGREPAEVRVELSGHFDPLAGRYVWGGRIRGLAEALPPDVVIAAGTLALVSTPEGSGECELSAIDLFGGHTVQGVTSPPFRQLPEDVSSEDLSSVDNTEGGAHR